MQGIDDFAAALRVMFGTEEFTAEDVMVALQRTEWPPAARVYSRHCSIATSLGKHLVAVPGIQCTKKAAGRTRTTYRLPS